MPRISNFMAKLFLIQNNFVSYYKPQDNYYAFTKK